MDYRSSSLQETVGETAGRGARIEAHHATGIDLVTIECPFELAPGAADKWRFDQQLKIFRRQNLTGRLLGYRSPHKYLAFGNQPSGLLAAGRQAPPNQFGIESSASGHGGQASGCSAKLKRRSVVPTGTVWPASDRIGHDDPMKVEVSRFDDDEPLGGRGFGGVDTSVPREEVLMR